jgi:hypothetical protein
MATTDEGAVPEKFLRQKRILFVFSLIPLALFTPLATCPPLPPAKSTLNQVSLASLEVPLLAFWSFSFSTPSTLLPKD